MFLEFQLLINFLGVKDVFNKTRTLLLKIINDCNIFEIFELEKMILKFANLDPILNIVKR